MKMKLRKANGDEGHILVKSLEMEDPTFESETPHVAHALFQNPKAIAYAFTAELYLGKTVGSKVVTSGVVSFSLAAGASQTVNFTVTTPRITVTPDPYHVYLEVKQAGVTLITFVGTDDVITIVIPAINVTTISWD